jgi:hypothetical protein
MKSLSKFSKAAITGFFIFIVMQIFSACNCPKHASKGGGIKPMYGCASTEYREININGK